MKNKDLTLFFVNLNTFKLHFKFFRGTDPLEKE